MKMKNKITFNKMIVFLLTLITLAACTCRTGFNVDAKGGKYDDSELSVKVSMGYSDTDMKLSEWTPVYFIMENKTDKDIEGVVVVSFSDLYGMGEEYEIKKEFVLPANVKKTIEVDCYCREAYNYDISARIESMKGKLLKDKIVLNNVSPYSRMKIGWISEDANGSNFISYLSGLATNNGDTIAIEHLTPNFFPSSEIMIDSFDMIIVDDIDFSESSGFTERQLKILEHYIKNDGMVFVGTGFDEDKYLRGFGEYFSGNVSDALVNDSGVFRDFASNIYFGNNKNNIDFTVKEAELRQVVDTNFDSSDAKPFYKHCDYNLYIAPFSFHDKNFGGMDCASWFVCKAFSINSNLSNKLFGLNGYYYINQGTFLQYDVKKHIPNGIVVFVIFLVYIAVGIFVPYYLLKKKKKEKYFWIAAPVMAFIFSVIIICYGSVLHGRSRTNSINVIRLNDSGVSTAKVLSQTFVTGKGKMNLSYDIDDYMFCSSPLNYTSNQLESVKSEIYYGKEDKLKLSGISSNSYLSSNCVYGDTSYNGLKIQVLNGKNQDEIVVTVENTTGKKISDAFIVFGDKIRLLGDMNPGDSAELSLSLSSLNSFSVDTFELIYELCYKELGISKIVAKSDKAFRMQNQYYYYNQSDFFSFFEDLKKDEKSFRRAWLLLGLQDIIQNEDSSDNVFFFGFDEANKKNVLLNGKKLGRNYCDTLLYKPINVHNSSINPTQKKAELIPFDSLNNCNVFDGKGRIVYMENNINGYVFYRVLVGQHESAFSRNVKISFDLSEEERNEISYLPELYLYEPFAGQLVPLDKVGNSLNSFFIKNEDRSGGKIFYDNYAYLDRVQMNLNINSGIMSVCDYYSYNNSDVLVIVAVYNTEDISKFFDNPENERTESENEGMFFAPKSLLVDFS